MLTNSFCWYFLSICLSCPPNPPQVCWYKSVVEAADLLSSLPQAPVSTDGYLLRSFSGVTLSNSLWNGQRNFFQLFPSLKKKSPRTSHLKVLSSHLYPHAESAHTWPIYSNLGLTTIIYTYSTDYSGKSLCLTAHHFFTSPTTPASALCLCCPFHLPVALQPLPLSHYTRFSSLKHLQFLAMNRCLWSTLSSKQINTLQSISHLFWSSLNS